MEETLSSEFPTASVKAFRINPEFRILRLTFHNSKNAELGRS